MATIQLKAEKREVKGRKLKALRKAKVLPANIFGKKIDSLAIQMSYVDFIKTFKEAGETSLIELMVGETKHPVLISNVQKDPVHDTLIHVDFHQVDLKEKVTATVQIELVGESPAEKSGLGTVVLQMAEIEVEALPTDLPEKFEIDASALTEVDQAVLVKDLVYDKNKVQIDVDPEQIVAKVEPPQKEEEQPVAPVAEAATPEAEGETPAAATEGEPQTSESETKSES